MKNSISSTSTKSDVGTIVMNHKIRLGNKYSFLFNKDVIGKAKSNLFTKPLKRTLEIDHDQKLEHEANTSASSGDTSGLIVRGDEV